MPEVACIGILVADVVAKPVDVLPERGRLVLASQFELHTGGCAANTGVGLARLGISTALAGKVGKDGFGDFLLRALAREGLDMRYVVQTEEASTSGTMVMVASDGERSFIHHIGANGVLRREDISDALLRSSKVVHVAGALLMPSLDGSPTADVLRTAKEAGAITCLDTAWDAQGRWMKAIAPALPYVDYFVPSFEEAKMLVPGLTEPEEVAKALREAGARVVVLKMGERGCYVQSEEESFYAPAYRVPVADATGAGDAFAAGWIAGLVLGWDLRSTAKLANAVGACCVMAIGATAGLRSLQETLQCVGETELLARLG